MSKTVIKIVGFKSDNMPEALRGTSKWANFLFTDATEKVEGRSSLAISKNYGWGAVHPDSEEGDILAEGEECLAYKRQRVLLYNQDGTPKMAYDTDKTGKKVPRMHKGVHLQQFTYRLRSVNEIEESSNVLDDIIQMMQEVSPTESEKKEVAEQMEGVK